MSVVTVAATGMRTFRESLGLSIEKMAEVSGRSVKQLRNIEAGALEHISDKTIANIVGSVSEWVTTGNAQQHERTTDMSKPKVRTWEILPCTTHGCIVGLHEWSDGQQDELCVCTNVAVAFEDGSLELVTGYRDADSGKWDAHSELETSILTGATGLEYLTRVTAAYKQVQELCDTLNSASAAVVGA